MQQDTIAALLVCPACMLVSVIQRLCVLTLAGLSGLVLLCTFGGNDAIPACQAYQAAIAKAVKKKKTAGEGAHVIDMGTGAGLLAMMAAKAGADSVVACDLHGTMCSVARKVRFPVAPATSMLMVILRCCVGTACNIPLQLPAADLILAAEVSTSRSAYCCDSLVCTSCLGKL